jgi:nickel-dependent lactate racemase
MNVSTTLAPDGAFLSADAVRAALNAIPDLGGARVLVLIPDHTRTIPLPLLFRGVVDRLRNAARLDFLVALGTHPPLSEAALNALVGISADERAANDAHVGLYNHAWDDPNALMVIGRLEAEQIQEIAGAVWHPSLGGAVDVRINRRIADYDHIVILSPVFPHEVVGFSGGAKYLFPGISGAEMINVTHWLGALATVRGTIGIADTPVRATIHAAARLVTTPITLVGMVVEKRDHDAEIAGLFIGDLFAAWRAAADVSARRHIVWLDQPVQRVLSCPSPMYDELWTAAKAMYKVDPAVADGGEVVIYAPHLGVVSHVHGAYIAEAGYHVRDTYLKQWERYKHLPLGVLAHGTHLRGSGTYEDGIERARVDVALATAIPRAETERLALRYVDPATIDPRAYADAGWMVVPNAGEILYRVRG